MLRPRAEDLISAISSIKHPIAGLTLTQSWVKQHAPEIVELRVEAENTPNGGELRHVRARVTGPDGEEDHARSIHFLPCHEQHGLFRSAEERAAESAAAESAAVADWAWMVHEVVRTSNFLADLEADTSTRWRAEIALPRYRWRHCWQCGEGEEQLGFGRLARGGTPYSTGPLLVMHEQRPAAAKRVCTKAASQEHSWTRTVPPKQHAVKLRRLPELLVSRLSALELKAELVEAWAVAFEARWGQARAAAAGVRDAVLRTRNVARIAQVAREAGICLKV